MKRRIAKKIAKKFLDGKISFPTRTEEWTSGAATWRQETVCARLPKGLAKAIYSEAERRGWDGCHWDNPMVISTERVDDNYKSLWK